MSAKSVKNHRFSAFQSQAERCYYCGFLMWLKDKDHFAKNHKLTRKEAVKFQCTAEHLVAQCDGGKDNKGNIVAACLFCNQKRHHRKKPDDPQSYKQLVQRRIIKRKWHPKTQHHLLLGRQLQWQTQSS